MVAEYFKSAGRSVRRDSRGSARVFARGAWFAGVRLAAAALWMLFPGCRAPQPTAGGTAEWTAERREALYARGEGTFATADFWKPPDEGVADVSAEMFPLIVEERAAGGIAEDAFGRVDWSADGACGVDSSRPTVYAGAATMVRGGVVFEQHVFAWFYPADGGSAGIRAMGMRVTLSPEGLPMVWEVASHEDDGAMVFVSQSLEDAAAAAFGEPLAGRRFSVEGDVSAAPELVVARVLADGPAPMGPFFYVGADRMVRTVICRCMPSQAESFRETRNYEVEAMDALPACAMEAFPEWFRGDGDHAAERLERAIRRPGKN